MIKPAPEGEPIFTLTPSTIIDRVWWVGFETLDTLMMIMKDSPSGKWYLRGQVRIHKDDEVWDSEDKKVVLQDDGEYEDLLSKARETMALAKDCNAPEIEEILINGGMDELMEILKHKSWFHMKKLNILTSPTPEEFLE